MLDDVSSLNLVLKYVKWC